MFVSKLNEGLQANASSEVNEEVYKGIQLYCILYWDH